VTRIALLTSEAPRARMAGIAVRYLEMARRLPAAGLEVVLVTPGDPAETPTIPGEVRRFARGGLRALLADCDAAVAQGQLANDLVLECPELPTAIDLYDPWLVENCHYYRTLGLDPYRNDHATWVLQLSRGDFFLCSSAEQRLYYLGWLTALGRVHPERLEADPTLAGLIGIVPFGIEEHLPAHQPVLPPAPPGTPRLLFGGLYDWYDPWVLLSALERLADRPWQLLLVENPNAEATPQSLWSEVRRWAEAKGWWGSRLVAIPWVAADRRFDLLRDVTALVATHRPSLETDLALRTRFLDALAAGCPVVSSAGGTIARLLTEREAGWVVPTGEPDALAAALAEVLGDEAARERRRQAGLALGAELGWERSLAPLAAFCRTPRRDASKEAFAFQPPTRTPPDRLGFRLKRRLRRLLAGGPPA
jgi:glycosyltransferase involved in cell wall biosynthesis